MKDDPKPDIQQFQTAALRIDEAFEAGASGQGRELLENALAQTGNCPAYHELFRGIAAEYLAGEKEDSVRRLRRALELSPDDPFLARTLGIALAARGHDEDALPWFDRALENAPDDAVAMRKKGVSLSRLGRVDEALMWFDNALSANPHDAKAMRNLGVTYSRSGRNEDALVWFDRALEVNPLDHIAMRQKGVSLAMLGDMEKALVWYDRSLELHPASIATLINKARALIELDRPEEAIATYDLIIAHDANNPFYHLEKAIALSKLNRMGESSRAVDTAFGLSHPSERLHRGKQYWRNRLGLDSARMRTREASGGEEPDADPGGEYGDIARVMEKTWEIFRKDIASFRSNIEDAKHKLNGFINSSGAFRKDGVFLLGARKWNSFTPTLPLGEDDEPSVGGGYFLMINGVGTVIDPGFNFLENFSAMGGRLADIHNIVVTHAHNDHTADLESILTLFYQRIKNAGKRSASRSRTKPPVNLYMNLGAFQKFSPILNLRSIELGDVRIIAEGEEYALAGSGASMRVLPAYHDEIFSSTYAVGLLFTLPTKPVKTILFTGDTGLFPPGADITAGTVGELEIGAKYRVKPGAVDYLVPHLGSIGENELNSPDRQERLGESFYPNHLGVQGVIRLATQIKPKYVFISEFGEELKNFIDLLMQLIQRCVREIGEENDIPDSDMPVLLPMDLFFFCDLTREEIYCLKSGSFAPLPTVVACHMDKDHTSQFYYESTTGDRPETDANFALKKLEYACKTGNGPFADTSNRTQRIQLGSVSSRRFDAR